MADPLITVDELKTWLRLPSFSTAEADFAALLLEAVSALVRSESGRTWAEPGDEVPDEVRAVTFAVAARVFRNPDAATAYSKTTGPFGESLTFADPSAVGMFLTAAEKAALPRRAVARGLWTQGTTRLEATAATGYVPVEGTATAFPWYAEDVTALGLTEG